jgi:DNA polymerase III subunit alpha
MTAPAFIHLKVHSAYSLLEGAIPIPKLAKLAAAYKMPALALTDTGNLFGALEFSDKAAAAGVQPIVGVTLAIDFRDTPKTVLDQLSGRNEPASKPAGPVALIAMNDRGYQNLMKLGSIAHMESGDTEGPHIKIEHLEEYGAGLIALTGGPDGPIDAALRNGQNAQAVGRLKMLTKAFPKSLYVELQRHGTPAEQQVEPELLALAYEHGLPIVATNEVYFATPDDYEAHDALLCIAGGRYGGAVCRSAGSG